MSAEEDNVEEQKSGGTEEGEMTFGIDLEATDTVGTDWMKKTFVARDEVDSNVTKAKDANMKESSEDWYPMDDPRNPVNMRRRGAK